MSRIFIDAQQPRINRAHNSWAAAITVAADAAGLERTLVELVNLRVSQLNGCAACLNSHYRKALEAGETVQRIAVLAAWRDAGLFSERERAALGLAEVIATLPDEQTTDRAFALAAENFTDNELGVLEWVAIAINSFNRVSIMSRHPVRPAASEG